MIDVSITAATLSGANKIREDEKKPADNFLYFISIENNSILIHFY